MSMRSSLLNQPAILSITQLLCHTGGHLVDALPPGRVTKLSLERHDRVFDLFRQCLVIIAGQHQRGAERDPRARRTRHAPGVMEHLIHPLEAHRYYWHAEAGGDHAHAGPKAVDLSAFRMLPLREDHDRVAVFQEGADIAQRLT